MAGSEKGEKGKDHSGVEISTKKNGRGSSAGSFAMAQRTAGGKITVAGKFLDAKRRIGGPQAEI